MDNGGDYVVWSPAKSASTDAADAAFPTLGNALAAVDSPRAVGRSTHDSQAMSRSCAPGAVLRFAASARPLRQLLRRRDGRKGASGEGTELDPWSAWSGPSGNWPNGQSGQLTLPQRPADRGSHIGKCSRPPRWNVGSDRGNASPRSSSCADGCQSWCCPCWRSSAICFTGHGRCSPSFILDNPENYMTAGGIWAPLVGTFFLAIISLVIDAPIGILAGVYLNEYAPDNWLTRMINLAVVNLAGVPSIVHGLFGVGAFVLFARMGKSVHRRLLHAGRDEPAGDHYQHAGGAGLSAHVVPRGLLEHGGQPLADHPHDRPAQFASAAS